MRALVWQGTEPKDLNDFVAGPSPFQQLLAANSISDAGEIIGMGVTQTGDVHAFLATPNNGAVPGGSFSHSTKDMGHPVVPVNVRQLFRGRFGSHGR